jgi:hypothetical protein
VLPQTSSVGLHGQRSTDKNQIAGAGVDAINAGENKALRSPDTFKHLKVLKVFKPETDNHAECGPLYD